MCSGETSERRCRDIGALDVGRSRSIHAEIEALPERVLQAQRAYRAAVLHVLCEESSHPGGPSAMAPRRCPSRRWR